MNYKIFIGLIIWLFPMMVQANYDEQSTMEENLQYKAQHILDTMYGKNNFSVSATVKLGRESWKVNYTDRAAIDVEEKGIAIRRV